MERQLPLPRSVRPPVYPIPPLAPEHAVLVFEGLFPSASGPGLPLARHKAGTSDALEYEARLQLQFFYGARQIVKQVLCEFHQSGEPTCSGFAALFPRELLGASGADVLYMEVNYLDLVIKWVRSLQKKGYGVSYTIAQHVCDEIYNRLYAYWPLPEFRPFFWTDKHNPLEDCREFAQGWLFGHHSTEPVDNVYVWRHARHIQPPLAEAIADQRVPSDLPGHSLSGDQIAQLEDVYLCMQEWAIQNHEDMLWIQLYPTRHVVYLFLCGCFFKLLYMQRQIEVEKYQYVVGREIMPVRVLWLLRAVEQRDVLGLDYNEINAFTRRKETAVKECLQTLYACMQEASAYSHAQHNFSQAQALHRLRVQDE